MTTCCSADCFPQFRGLSSLFYKELLNRGRGLSLRLSPERSFDQRGGLIRGRMGRSISETELSIQSFFYRIELLWNQVKHRERMVVAQMWNVCNILRGMDSN